MPLARRVDRANGLLAAVRRHRLKLTLVLTSIAIVAAGLSTVVDTVFDLDVKTKAVAIDSAPRAWVFLFPDCPPNIDCRIRIGSEDHPVAGARLIFDAGARVSVTISGGAVAISQSNPEAAAQVILRTASEEGGGRVVSDDKRIAVPSGTSVFLPLNGTWIDKTRDLIAFCPTARVTIGAARQSNTLESPTPLIGGTMRIFSSFLSWGSGDYMVNETPLAFSDVVNLDLTRNSGAIEPAQIRLDESGTMYFHARNESSVATLSHGSGTDDVPVRASLLEIFLANPHLKLALALIAAVTSFLGVRGLFKKENTELS
jgi:hypothetical protein